MNRSSCSALITLCEKAASFAAYVLALILTGNASAAAALQTDIDV